MMVTTRVLPKYSKRDEEITFSCLMKTPIEAKKSDSAIWTRNILLQPCLVSTLGRKGDLGQIFIIRFKINVAAYDRLIPGTWIVSYIFSYHFFMCIPVSENRPTYFWLTDPVFSTRSAWRGVDFIHFCIFVLFSRWSARAKTILSSRRCERTGPKTSHIFE